MNNSLIKGYPVVEDLTEEGLDENHSLKKILRLVGENKRVIDFGCATGYFSQLLSKKGCRVTGIEINPDAAKVASQYCEQVIVADLDLVSLAEILPAQAFDVAIFGDVLEHLRDPWRVLKETQQLLNREGYVVASIPNVAHGSIRLALLQGRFEYAELGILDNTHLRFFTRKTVEDLFAQAGYLLDTIERTKLAIFSDVPLIPHVEKKDFDRQILQELEREEEAETFQFIIRAFPRTQEGKYAALNERYSELIEQLERSQTELQHTQAELGCSQTELQHTQAELGCSQTELQHTQAELERSQTELQHTQAELERSQADLQHMQAELGCSQAELQHMQAELECSQAELQHMQAELERSQAELQHMQAELERSQAIISGMQSSKFWKLRSIWFRLKQAIGLTDNSPQQIQLVRLLLKQQIR